MTEWCPKCGSRIVSVTRGIPSIGICENGHSTDRRDTLRREPEPPCPPLYTHDRVQAMITEAVSAERKRCAQIAERMSIPIAGTPYQAGCGVVAEAIRKGEQP